MSNPAASFEPYRRRLLGLAYRMLGSIADAEDAVQETYLRWHAADRDKVSDPRAFLMTTTTRICLDMLTSARARREEYVGPWLPEPVVDTASARARQPHGAGRGFVHSAALDAGPAVAARAGCLPAARRVRFLVQRSGRDTGRGARLRAGSLPPAHARTCAQYDHAAPPRRRRVRARSMRSMRSSCPRSWRQRARAISMR